jgi:hypothetical protein
MQFHMKLVVTEVEFKTGDRVVLLVMLCHIAVWCIWMHTCCIGLRSTCTACAGIGLCRIWGCSPVLMDNSECQIAQSEAAPVAKAS